MNQFHTPSFGDEVFEMNDTPMEQSQHQIASRRLSRLSSSLDRTTLDDDDEEEPPMDYEAPNTYASNMISTNQQQQQQLLPQQQQQQQTTTSPQQPPAKPLAPYALFFRDTMTAIKQQNPACTLEQITAIALNMWESLDEKQKNVYEQRHEQDKREYLIKLRDSQRSQQEESANQQAPAQEEQQSSAPLPLSEDETNSTPIAAPTPEVDTKSAVVVPQPPDQIQLLTEAAAVQKCTRDQCSKPAIINPDWEDEYCSNECVVIHCRNVFTEWARSLQNSPT